MMVGYAVALTLRLYFEATWTAKTSMTQLQTVEHARYLNTMQ
jgi:hypothetical protein